MAFLSPSQCRAARALLDWGQPDLAKRSGMHVQTISSFENETGTPTQRTLLRIQETLELAGIEFIEHDGIRRRYSEICRFSGASGFESFLDDVYETAITHGTEESPTQVYLSNVVHQNWVKWMGPKKWENHVKRMTKDQRLMDVRIIVKEGDHNFPAQAYSKYKWFPESIFNEKSFYSYHDKLAFLDFSDNSVDITIMRQPDFAQGYRRLFDIAWNYVASNPDTKK